MSDEIEPLQPEGVADQRNRARMRQLGLIDDGPRQSSVLDYYGPSIPPVDTTVPLYGDTAPVPGVSAVVWDGDVLTESILANFDDEGTSGESDSGLGSMMFDINREVMCQLQYELTS